VAGAVVVAATPSLNGRVRALFAASSQEIVTYPVRKSSLEVTVSEKGNLESAENKDVHNQVEGATTIIFILPEGTPVKKGDKVVELDAATLRDNLKNQQITTKQAEASYAQAKLTREVAEVAVKEYEEGTYKQQFETVMGDIALAEAELSRADDRLKWTTQMVEKKYVSSAQQVSDELALKKAKFTLEQHNTSKKVLELYTREKTTKELKAEVEKARSDELAKKATFELEEDKEKKLERQIKNCILLAPGDGLVVYANDPGRMGQSQQVQIEEGASVRERQKIFSLPDITQMRVNTKVHESMVDKIGKGLRAKIRVDAFAAQELTGQVQSIAPLADQNAMFGSDIKVYTTLVGIENGPVGLRPGMSANVEILIARKDDVLSVPAQALLEIKGKTYVWVKDGEGFAQREVTLGLSNDKLVEIATGLKQGDQIAMTPSLLMTDEEKREAFGIAKDAAKKNWGVNPDGTKAALPEGVPVGKPAIPGPDGKGAAPGPDGKPAAKAKRKGGGAGGAAFFSKIQALDPDERAKLRGASDEERTAILKKAGLTDAEIEQMNQMRQNGGGGGPGGPGGGRPGGGPPQ
jgi:HlyD family secretion protein